MGVLERINNVVTRTLPLKTVRSHADAALVSITFDDFPKSAWTLGGPILARYGARATYYAAGGFCGRTEEGVEYYNEADLAAVRAAGHEVGCHSFAHQQAPTVPSGSLATDLDRNAAFLGGDMVSYAYPYGQSSPRTKALMSRRFANARGIRSGVNAGWIDLAQLKAIPIEHRRWIPEEIDAALDAAVASNGWVVFFTHDVAEAPTPFGATPEMLNTVLAKVAVRGIEVLPVKHAMARCVFGHAA